jgi:hypothetical protein
VNSDFRRHVSEQNVGGLPVAGGGGNGEPQIRQSAARRVAIFVALTRFSLPGRSRFLHHGTEAAGARDELRRSAVM